MHLLSLLQISIGKFPKLAKTPSNAAHTERERERVSFQKVWVKPHNVENLLKSGKRSYLHNTHQSVQDFCPPFTVKSKKSLASLDCLPQHKNVEMFQPQPTNQPTNQPTHQPTLTNQAFTKKQPIHHQPSPSNSVMRPSEADSASWRGEMTGGRLPLEKKQPKNSLGTCCCFFGCCFGEWLTPGSCSKESISICLKTTLFWRSLLFWISYFLRENSFLMVEVNHVRSV